MTTSGETQARPSVIGYVLGGLALAALLAMSILFLATGLLARCGRSSASSPFGQACSSWVAYGSDAIHGGWCCCRLSPAPSCSAVLTSVRRF
jgi:hypothetical protein